MFVLQDFVIPFRYGGLQFVSHSISNALDILSRDDGS